MPKKSGFEWNKSQLIVGKMLYEGKLKPKHIAEKGICTLWYAQNVQRAIKKGDLPESFSDEFIAAAPEGHNVGQTGGYEVKHPQATGDSGSNGEQAPAPMGSNKPKGEGSVPPIGTSTTEITEATALKLVPKVQSIPLTPDIFIGYMCALARGFEGDIADWLSLASRDFWYGREINPYEVVSGFTTKDGSSSSEGAESKQAA